MKHKKKFRGREKINRFRLEKEKDAALQEAGVSFESDPKAYNAIIKSFNEKFKLQLKIINYLLLMRQNN